MTKIPQFLGLKYSSIASTLTSPHLMTGILRTLLMEHFQKYMVQENELRDLIWKPTEDTTILIESSGRWDPKKTERRPGVVIKQNTYTTRKLGIDNRLQGAIQDRSSAEYFALNWVGSHTLFCIGGTEAQASLIGTEVARELAEYGPKIREFIDLQSFQVMEMAAPAKLEEARENSIVPITVACEMEERWLVREQAPRLTHLSLRTLLDV